MSSNFLALLLIFGLGHHARDPVDLAKGVPLHSRLKCDGYGSPEDLLRLKAKFSAGGSLREFVISRFQVDKCGVETMFQCWHKERAGWNEVWSVENEQPSARALVPVGACNEWGSEAPAQYVLSGWYQAGSAGSKPVWKQTAIKQVSAQPEVYAFTDPNGGTARLEITR